MKQTWNRRDLVKMSGCSRRELGKIVGAGLVCGLSPGWAAPALGRRSARRTDEMQRLAEEIAATPRARVFDLVRPLLRDGLPWEELQGAVFFAGIREIRPRPVGFKLHAVLVTESVYQLAEASPPDERLLAVLWNLDDFKASQERDVREGDWTLPAPPAVSFSSKEEAVRELRVSLERWDDERADRAVVGALPFLELAELFELLWPFALRDFHNLGHKPIFATHVARVLRRVGAFDERRRAEPALRSLVHGLLDARPGSNVEEFRASRRIARSIRTGWTAGERVPGRSLEIARAIRAATPAEARALVVERLNEGLDPLTVWDGLRLAATDLFVRQPGLLPVHPTTVSSALFHVFRTAASDETRRVALLQAASWLPLFRDALSQRVGFSMTEGGIDPLVAEREPELIMVDELFAAPSLDGALACLGHAGALEPYAAALRTSLFRGVQEHHQPKYTAVILEDARSADPAWHAALLAPALQYLPSAATAPTRLFERSRALVAGLGRSVR